MSPVASNGSAEPLPGRVPLRAGPLSLVYCDGDLRDVMLGDVEVVRRVYMVFQDLNWTARPWSISNERVSVGLDSFDIAFEARGSFDAHGFTWTGHLTGDPEGRVSYTVDGRAAAAFLRNRLGICVLHPIDGTAGRPCVVETVAGDLLETAFPLEISPHQPFLDVRAITHESAPGARICVRLLGETFETEDHRNWSDASYKTYSTPISLPFPVEVAVGETLRQSAVISVDLDTAAPVPTSSSLTPTITVDPALPSTAMPGIGLQLSPDALTLTDAEILRLRALRLDHLRVDIDASDPDAATRLRTAAQQARSIDTRLVVAAFVSDQREWAALVGAAADIDDVIDAWLVFDPNRKVTSDEWIAVARERLGPDARIGGGTNLYFTELNREPPDVSHVDVIAFSLNPQVHASDQTSLVQNLSAQAAIAANAPRLAGSARMHVGPITLRPRFNPNATDPTSDHSNTALPASVDARQLSRLAAAWTIGSIKNLSEGGAIDALTYFETTGWRGVMERAEGSSQPDDFPSTPAEPFPVYDALLATRGFARVRQCSSNAPQQVDGLLLEGDDSGRLLLANFTDESLDVAVEGLPGVTSPVRVDPYSFTAVDYRRALP